MHPLRKPKRLDDKQCIYQKNFGMAVYFAKRVLRMRSALMRVGRIPTTVAATLQDIFSKCRTKQNQTTRAPVPSHVVAQERASLAHNANHLIAHNAHAGARLIELKYAEHVHSVTTKTKHQWGKHLERAAKKKLAAPVLCPCCSRHFRKRLL